MPISAIPGNVQAVVTPPSQGVDPATAKQAGQSASTTTSPTPKHDSVKLTGTALAKSLKHLGKTPAQIAQAMSTDIKTVDSYLGLKAPVTAPAPEPATETQVAAAAPQAAATDQAATAAPQAKADTKA